LKGKTSRVIVIAGTHSAFKTWWRYGDFTNEISDGILGFAGVKAKVTVLGPCDKVSEGCKLKWMKQIEKLAKKGY